MLATSLPCPYCGIPLALFPCAPWIVRHCCPATKTWQSGCVRPLEEGGTWFLGIKDQVHLTAEIVVGSGCVEILTGRWERAGIREVLVKIYRGNDLAAFDALDRYCAGVEQDRAAPR